MSYEKVGDQFPVQPPLEAGPTQQPPNPVQPPQFQQPPPDIQPPSVQQPLPVQQPPQTEKPPPYAYPSQSQPPLNEYHPASSGPMFGQQQQQTNVVVVTSQPAQPAVFVRHQVEAPDYMTLTIVGFVLCFFCGGVVGMILLVPALVCSIMAQNANSSGDYEGARNLGRASLCWNISSYIIYTVVAIVLVIVVVVLHLNSSSSTYSTCYNDVDGYHRC